MDDKAASENPKEKDRFKWFAVLQYWIAVISYLVIFSLSMLCLVYYLPHLSEGDALDLGTLNVLTAMLIIVLIVSTAAFGWEMIQWRRRKAKKEQPSIEELIKSVKNDSNSSN